MQATHPRIRVHFFGRQGDRPVGPLAGALGVGSMPEQSGTALQRYDRLARVASEVFEVVAAEVAEVWLYAHELGSVRELELQVEQLPHRSPPCVFFYGADDVTPIPVARPNIRIFRTSLFASKRLPHERAMPALCDDLLTENGNKDAERRWTEQPSVGFCGFVGSPLKRLGFQVLGQHQKNDGLILRDRVLAAIEDRPGLRTEFVRRSSFWGGSMSRFHFNSNLQREVRAEFVRNLLGTDYGLCVRGKGNFSYRFYEVLSAGRIPVFVNSDCILPFDQQIDWKRHVIWLEEGEIESSASRILEFHRALGADGFAELQRENRRLWEEWLSPEGFFQQALKTVATEDRAC